jgi:hypoxanthine phosphoribosyltransferase
MNKVITWKEIDKQIYTLKEILTGGMYNFNKIDYIFGTHTGGIIPAIKLSKLLNIPLTLSDLNPFVKNYLIITDIIRTGQTIEQYNNNYVLSLYCTENCQHIPNFYGEMVDSEDDWLIFPWEV